MKMIPKPQKARPNYWGPNGAADASPVLQDVKDKIPADRHEWRSTRREPDRLFLSPSQAICRLALYRYTGPHGKSHWGPLQTVGDILTGGNEK